MYLLRCAGLPRTLSTPVVSEATGRGRAAWRISPGSPAGLGTGGPAGAPGCPLGRGALAPASPMASPRRGPLVGNIAGPDFGGGINKTLEKRRLNRKSVLAVAIYTHVPSGWSVS